MTASSSGCTPLFLKALPQSTAVILEDKHGATDRVLQQLRSDRLLVGEVGLHQVVVVVGDQLDQRVVSCLRLLNKSAGISSTV